MAVKFEILDNSNVTLLQFEAQKKLTFTKDYSKNYIKYGSDNLFPNYIVSLYKEHPEHRTIVNSKSMYLTGKGIKPVNENDATDLSNVIKLLNKNGSIENINFQIGLSFEMFNGVYFEIINNAFKKPIQINLLNPALVRFSECKTKIYYSKDWSKDRNGCEISQYINGKSIKGFVKFEFYTPSTNQYDGIYPQPQYLGVTKEIQTDIDISTFNKNYVANGFSASTIITFFNGELDNPTKAKIKERVTSTYNGVENAGKTFINYVDKDGKAAEVTSMNIDDLDKKFEFTSKRCMQKIVSGHDIKNADLFGIKISDGGLIANRVNLLDSQELFVKSYVEPRQELVKSMYRRLTSIVCGREIEVEIESINLIGLDLYNDPDLTQDERRTLKGYESLTTSVKPQAQAVNDAINSLSPLVANKVLESMTEDEIRALASLPSKTAKKLDVNGNEILADTVNSTLTNLTGRQTQGLMRIVRNYENGKIALKPALTLMQSGFGLTEQQALEFLNTNDNSETPIQLSAEDKVYLALEASAEDANEEDEIVLMEYAHIHNAKQAQQYENQLLKFADAIVITATDVDNAVLNLLKSNPEYTSVELATALNIEEYKIQESLSRLVANNLVTDTLNGFLPTDKGISKETEPIEATQIYTRYVYALADNAPPLKKGGTSRPFCKKMMALSANGKEWKFETIDNMSNQLGTNVWDYRGGFYTKPNTTETSPSCRHVWLAVTRKRKVLR
ncbi:MAG: hypothetical protein KBE91_02655 [Bacteroidia bacterium]|nr:hypothetical protein [Bacteroidia bacterium]